MLLSFTLIGNMISLHTFLLSFYTTCLLCSDTCVLHLDQNSKLCFVGWGQADHRQVQHESYWWTCHGVHWPEEDEKMYSSSSPAPDTIYRTDFDILQIYNENTERETSKQLRKSASGKIHRPRSDQELSITVESTPKSTTHHICLTTTVWLRSFVPSATDRKQNSTLNKWSNVSRCLSFSPVFLTVRHKVSFSPRWLFSCFCQFPPTKTTVIPSFIYTLKTPLLLTEVGYILSWEIYFVFCTFNL